MIELVKDEYTFSEVARMLRISKDKVAKDFRKKIFSAKKKRVCHEYGSDSHNNVRYRLTAKLVAWVAKRDDVRKYIKYVTMIEKVRNRS